MNNQVYRVKFFYCGRDDVAGTIEIDRYNNETHEYSAKEYHVKEKRFEKLQEMVSGDSNFRVDYLNLPTIIFEMG